MSNVTAVSAFYPVMTSRNYPGTTYVIFKKRCCIFPLHSDTIFKTANSMQLIEYKYSGFKMVLFYLL